MTQFTDLQLSAPILKALAGEGYTSPNADPGAVHSHLLQGRDLLGIAQTGTGKTAAFALPILERLSQETERAARGTCKVLVPVTHPRTGLADRRKLQDLWQEPQASRALSCSAASPSASRLTSCRGGVDVVIATPGRLVDLIERKALTLSRGEGAGA